MNAGPKYLSIFIVILLAGGFLRLQHLDLRPMHNDEAVNAVKFGILLERGTFIYDREEYHGPLLYYLTLVPAGISGITKFKDLDEYHLRIVSVFAGMALLLIALLLRGLVGRHRLLAVIFIMAISPAMVFYNRYFIHESLLVLCSFALIITGFLYFESGKKKWLIMAGISLGGMHASKETFVLAATALVLAVVLDRVLWKERSKSITATIHLTSWRHMLAFTGIAVLTSVLFYSSFFKNPQGIIDSVSTYGNYLSRATGNEIHHHPWYYYIAMLTWNPGPGWIVWSELPVLIMSLYGMIVVFRKTENNRADQFFRVMALFTLLLLVIYSMIPYKTPWNMLTFYVGMTWLAGYGTVHLFMQLKNPVLKILFSTFLLISAAFLLIQVLMANTKYPADSSNPYVYAHTSTDVYHMTGQIEEVAAKHPEGKSLYIQVVAPDHDYWPLPWYLRKYNHVGWWNQVDVETPLAPVIIASPVFEEQLIEKMYKFPEPGERYLYVPLFNEGTELRPGTRLNGYIRQDIR